MMLCGRIMGWVSLVIADAALNAMQPIVVQIIKATAFPGVLCSVS